MRKILKTKPSIKQQPVQRVDTPSAEDVLRHLAFDNSLQANIITTVSSGKIIMVNKAACELLGYSEKQLLTKSRSGIFNIRETGFKKMLKERTEEGQSVASVTVIRKDGLPIPSQITSAVFTDEKGIEKAITTINDLRPAILKQLSIDVKNEKTVTDNINRAQVKQKHIDSKKAKIVADNIILAQAKADERLAEYDAWVKYHSKSSYDVMWDWDIESGRIFVGDSVEEVFGYTAEKNIASFADFTACLLPDEKTDVEKKLKNALEGSAKSWDDMYRLRRRDGSIASTISRATIVRNSKGKAIRLIGAIQDVTRLHELEQQLTDQTIVKKSYSEIFRVAANLSYDGIWDWNLLTNDFFLGEGFDELFGYHPGKLKGRLNDWSKHLHPEDKRSVEAGLQNAIASKDTHWEHAYRFIRADGSIANVLGRASIIRDENGKACRMIGAIHDMSKQKVLEERLDQEIRLKEIQIAEAAEDAKDAERSDIGKELHDNVNQLLGASRMYLEMAKRGGEKTEMYLGRSSEYTLTAIEEIRKLTKGLTTDIIRNLGLCEAIENAAKDMMEVNDIKISCNLETFTENSVTNKFKLNIFRIVQEHLNNILKHAKSSSIDLKLLQDKKHITLMISDNGIGFDIIKKRAGIGIDNIKSRASTYGGTAEFISKPGHGCMLTIKFPLPKEE